MKYSDYVYECLRQNMGLNKDDTSYDDDIDAICRSEVFNRFCNWHGVISWGYDLRKYVKDIFGVDLDEQVDESSNSVGDINKYEDEKYSDAVYSAVKQRLGYDEDDMNANDEVDKLSRFEVFNETVTWDGLIDYGEEISEWIEDIYGVVLYDYEDIL